MVGSIAAIQGWQRGSAKGVSQARQRQIAASRELKQKQQVMANTIIKAYDKDGSGGLSKSELVPMLNACSLETYGEETHPGPEDVEFLLNLCEVGGRGSKRANGTISKNEVLGVVDAWTEFVKGKRCVLDSFDNFDADRSGSIDLQELQNLLDELKEAESLTHVQPEVTSWIFKQADINCNGALSVMELARALCAFDVWLGKRTQCPLAPDRMLAGISKDPKLSTPSVKPGVSAFCTIS